ncbi:ANTAR domain-containing protein [Acidiphilium sp. AL]|uniref:ANTAR domain-containing protein n=1 Tax=Acidiphilium iwatense TaxID=768198 RepID=A0ABS9DXN9_9PROT|nr:ANTAR domain-containing protein [Acidiphilium sp. AL]MCF3947506.1 ANTAR domain-containing protein [Acidiphilium iwatense]MCU4158559.1 ANTAR domain-containing protein [Acidiphilium sp. AL]
MDILIAETDSVRAAALAVRLEQMGVGRVRIAPPASTLADIVNTERPDLVIVDMARPDRGSPEQVRKVTASGVPVTLFVDEDDPAFMEAAITAGVVSYHVNAAVIADIRPVLRSAIALFRYARTREARLAAAEAELADRRRVDAAKRLLMRRDGMAEPVAHRFLQRRAMERQMRLPEVARALLREAGEDLA